MDRRPPTCYGCDRKGHLKKKRPLNIEKYDENINNDAELTKNFEQDLGEMEEESYSDRAARQETCDINKEATKRKRERTSTPPKKKNFKKKKTRKYGCQQQRNGKRQRGRMNKERNIIDRKGRKNVNELHN